jgi:tyrosine-protein phosphatase SIW14
MPVFAQPGHSDVLSSVRIANFGAVNTNYYRGAQPVGQDYADLRALGVKTIIDFQKDGDRAEPGMVQSLGMKYVRIPMTTRIVPTPQQVNEFLSIVNDPANQPVYVHCAGGRHRTGVMTAIYRMTGDGWTSQRAFAEMKQYNFGADYLHPEFKKYVFAFEPGPLWKPAAPALASQPGPPVGSPAVTLAGGVPAQ